MVFSMRLFRWGIEVDSRARRTLRLRNHLYGSPYWGKINVVVAEFAEILIASIRKGIAAVKKIIFPAAVIQSVMIALAISYFYYIPLREVLDAVVRWKDHIGSSYFSFLSMGLIAVFAETLRCKSLCTLSNSGFIKASLFGFFVFGCLGLATDAFYWGQNFIWKGLSTEAQVPAKVLSDQFVWTVFFANPYQTFLYVLKDCRFDLQLFVNRIFPFNTFYAREVLAVLITNWGFWIPTACIIYSLPLNLQLIISRLAILIWVLLLTTITSKE